MRYSIKTTLFFLIPTGLSKGSVPPGQRRVKSQIYDNLIVGSTGSSGGRKQKRVSAPGLFVSFDPVDEWDEQEDQWDATGTGNGRVASIVGGGGACKVPLRAPDRPQSCSTGTGNVGARDKNGRSRFSAPLGVYQRRHKMEAPKAPARTKRLHGGKDAAKDDGTSPLDENEEWAKVGVGQFTIWCNDTIYGEYISVLKEKPYWYEY